MKKFYVVLIFSCIILYIFSSCDSSNPVDNTKPKDPCLGYVKQPVKIKIFEKLGDTTYPLIDEFYGGSSQIVFAASRKCDTYQWSVGTDIRVWTDSSFRLTFGENSGPIEVRLITFTAKDTLCIAGDDGWDTVAARYTIIKADPRTDIAPMTGIFRGVSTEDLRDTLDVKIGKVGTGILWEAMSINNLPKGCIDPPDPKKGGPQLRFSHGRRGIFIHKDESWYGGNCRNMYGYGWISENRDTLTIRYNAHAVGDYNKRIDAVFHGVRQ